MNKLEETIGNLKYDGSGLIPAICVDAESKQVLMHAYMNREALSKTVETGKAHFFSRSRKKLWMKGESSGHTQEVKGIYVDCDMDTLLIEVIQNVAACHMGYRSCFFRKLNENGEWEIVGEKAFDPDDVYKEKQ